VHFSSVNDIPARSEACIKYSVYSSTERLSFTIPYSYYVLKNVNCISRLLAIILNIELMCNNMQFH